MENIIIGCDCCRYTAEIAIDLDSSGSIVMGKIYCSKCNHPKFLFSKIVHRLYDWYWVKRYLSND